MSSRNSLEDVREAHTSLLRLEFPTPESDADEVAHLYADVAEVDSELAGHLASLASDGRFARDLDSTRAEEWLAWDPELEARGERLSASPDELIAADGGAFLSYVAELKRCTNVARGFAGLEPV